MPPCVNVLKQDQPLGVEVRRRSEQNALRLILAIQTKLWTFAEIEDGSSTSVSRYDTDVMSPTMRIDSYALDFMPSVRRKLGQTWLFLKAI